MSNVHVQQLRGGPLGGGSRDVAGGARAGNFHGVELTQVQDVDDINFDTALRSAITEGNRAQSATRNPPQPRKSFNVRSLTMQQLARHAKVSGDARDVHSKSAGYLRQRLLLGQRLRLPNWKLAGMRPAMRQYLALQKLQAALKLQQAARQEKRREEEAEDEFMAAMAPLSDNPGNAAALAHRFYEALGRDDLEDLLSGFEDDQRLVLMEELRGCDVIEEYDPKNKAYRKTFDRRQFSAALHRALGLGHYRLSEDAAQELLQDVQGQMAEMESDPEFDRYASGALNIVSVAEELQQQGEDVLQFIDNFNELIHAEASMASMCKRAAQLYIPQEGHIDLPRLRLTMEAASRAAFLDMDSARPAAIDKDHLWAAIQSTKLIARLSTAVMLAETARSFLHRHFGREIDSGKLLHELLERMANPNASPTAHIEMAKRMKLDEEAMPATLKQAADFFRTMHDMYPDPQTRQTLLQNVLDALDEAARLEDERLSNQVDVADVIPIAAPGQPLIPSAQKGVETWTGFNKR